MRPALTGALLAALSVAGCGDDAAPPTADVVRPRILAVRASVPQLPGTALRVTASNRDSIVAAPRLRVESTAGGEIALYPRSADEWTYELTARLVDALGPGRHAVDLILEGESSSGEERLSDVFPYELEIAEDLAFALTEVPSGSVFRNEPGILLGDGVLEAAEGSMVARFDGTFTADGGSPSALTVELPVSQAEPGDRARGLVILGTELGGSLPGTFEGTVTLVATLAGRLPVETASRPTTLRFQPPAIFSLAPDDAALEHVVRIRGGGFLGGEGVPLVRLDGTFAAGDGGSSAVTEELFPTFVDGETLEWVLDAETQGDALVSTLFGATEGVFQGTATPVTIDATDREQLGDPAPVELTLGPVRQVVLLRFLPGFYESLPRFGLAAAAGEVEERVAERIESIFGAWRVDVRLERPEDVSAAGYARVEIGGPDPNGLGLFGYDNSPGKDVGNLRLFDAIGGANAETQADGYPGFGGVFVESMLMWSSHPDMEGGAGPEPDPLFDEIFDPVRERHATAAEIAGSGARATVVQRALDALAAAIGETTAHELGHSFGLAAPYGPATTFHNMGDGNGCLMDSGGSRPFGERAAQPGYAQTGLCGDAATYLDEILGNP